LAERAAVVLLPWLVRRSTIVLGEAGSTTENDVTSELTAAVTSAAVAAIQTLYELAGADLDDQRTTPLAAVRSAVSGAPTAILAQAGIPLPATAPGEARARSGDKYGLAPDSWAEVDDELAELALQWGAVKAAVHRRRHQS